MVRNQLTRLLFAASLVSCVALGQGSATRGAVSVTQIKAAAYCADVSGAANTITCTTAVGFSYADGDSLDVKLANSISGATTINVNGLGSKAVTYNGTTAMSGSVGAVAGSTCRLQYDGTRFVLQGIVNTSTGSGTVATGTQNQVARYAANGTTVSGSTVISDDATNAYIAGPLDIKANPFIVELPNSATGTTNNKLAKVVNTGGVLQAQIITTSAADQAAAIGCVISGGGVTGTALIMIAGTGSCFFDAATTAGHIAIPSATSAGALHDTGATSTPATGETLATVGATNACGSPPCLIAGNLFMTPDITSVGSGGNGGNGGNGGGVKKQQYVAPCEIVVGGTESTAGVLANDSDTPFVCANTSGNTLTIASVKCVSNLGSPTVTPIVTGGGATSILSSALTCGTGSFATGTLNGTPTLAAGGTIDGNITSAGGTSTYLVIQIAFNF